MPCGIENIRPHLEEMDNVPLLVSLFTDCTPSSTQEMVKILQAKKSFEIITQKNNLNLLGRREREIVCLFVPLDLVNS